MVEALKDSKVEWLGKIPEDWKVERIGTLYSLRNSKVSDEDYPPLSVTMQGILPQLETVAKTDDHSNRKLVKKGDFAINSRSDRRGSCGISDYDGSVSLINIVLKPNAKMNPVYYNWLFHTSLFADEFYKWGHGIVDDLWTTNWQDMKNIFVTIPPLDEQKLIADFLDEKCTEIDKLSEDIQKQIDILNDYKKSVITRAVTKGLDPNAEMKDGRVDWAKNIPKTWKVTKLKYLFDFGKGLNITKADLVPEGLPVVSYGQIHSKLNDKTSLSEELLRFVDNRYQVRYPQCRIKQGDFVFADTSEDYEGCGNCVYKRDNSKVFAGYHSIILKAKQNSDNRYLAYLFTTDLWRKQIRTAVSGVKVFSITQNILSRASVILPPEKEKLIIADYLDGVCSDIEYSISAKYSQLENLTIYKKSIIYEYVTGKKRVKGAL